MLHMYVNDNNRLFSTEEHMDDDQLFNRSVVNVKESDPEEIIIGPFTL